MVALRAAMAAKEDRLRALEDRLSSLEAELAARAKNDEERRPTGRFAGRDLQKHIARFFENQKPPQVTTRLRARGLKHSLKQYAKLFEALDLTKQDQAEFRRHLFHDDQDALRELLGEEDYQHYRDYEAKLDATATVQQLAKRLERQQQPALTEDQRKRLIELLEEAHRPAAAIAQPKPTDAAADDGFFIDLLGEEPPPDVNLPEVLRQSRQILSAEQLPELKHVLKHVQERGRGVVTTTHQTFTFGGDGKQGPQGSVVIQVTGDGEDVIQIGTPTIEVRAAAEVDVDAAPAGDAPVAQEGDDPEAGN
jgi:hypothetical protein